MNEIESQYQVLAEIKEIDEKIYLLQTEIDHIPTELEELESVLEGKRTEFESIKELYEGHKKRLREAEGELKVHEDKISKAEEKLMEVKTNEAYTAAISEINGQKNEKTKLEDEILSLMTELEVETTKFKESEGQFKEQENIFNQNKKRLDEENKKLAFQLKELDDKKKGITSKLEPSAATIYTRVSSRVTGSPVVEIAGGMCTGCRIKIRPQLYNEIIGFVSVKQCPSCGKILIPPPAKEEEATPDVAKS